MTKRYVGTGEGAWHGDWYVYVPSVTDRITAARWAQTIEDRHAASRVRGGYGNPGRGRIDWQVRGILGEIAGLFPIGQGPALSSKNWRGTADFGQLEVRTTSWMALRGGSERWPTLAGWPVMARDIRDGLLIIAVEDRGDDFAVMGCLPARRAQLLDVPLGGVVAVVYPDALEDLASAYASGDA